MVSNIQKYKAFLATVEYGSFTKAAEVLQYTQSAISRMIQDLETEWNVTLFERRKTGIILTSVHFPAWQHTGFLILFRNFRKNIRILIMNF